MSKKSAPSQPLSQSVSLLPINGTTFSPGGKIVFEIAPDLGMIKAARGETYLVFTVRNNSSTPLRWMLATSGQALIQDVTVFSMETGQQLEHLQNYNQAMWLLDQYSHASHGVQQTVEGMVAEPFSLEVDNTDAIARRVRFSDGNSDKIYNSVFSPIDEDGNPATTSAGVFPQWQVCVPLKLGIFSCFQEEKLTPVMLLGGLRIEMTLSNAQPACVPLVPLLNGLPLREPIATPSIASATGIPCVQGATTSILAIEDTDIESSGLVVGQTMAFDGGVDVASTTIAAMSNVGTSMHATFSNVVDCSGTSARVSTTASQWASALNYAVEGCELRTMQVVPSDLGSLNKNTDYQFRTYELFFDSIPASERRHQVEIHSVSSMAKSIMALLYDSSEELDESAPSYFLGSDPDTLNLNSVQFFINNRLYPLQSYDPRRHQDRPQTFNELQKAFSAMGSPVESFGDGEASNLDSYSNTFLVCRELARGNYVYNLKDTEPSIRLGFSATRSNITRVNTFVWSDRIARVDSSGVTLIL